jgi:pyruvate/2-oxoglutarate dehydrogenase complex dihydrolipoamide acyltransferase (E2) component
VAHEFHLPDIGEGLAEAVILHWHVQVGEVVGLDEPLVEVETDKAVVDIPSPFAGVLLHQGVGAGETIEVDSLLAVVGEAGEEWEVTATEEASSAAAPIVGSLSAEAESVVRTAAGRQPVLPGLRRLAGERGVDVDALVGSGPGGRITEADIEAAADDGRSRRVRLSPTRRAIAAHLTRSWREIPHVTTYAEVDADPLLARRAALGRPPLEALLIERITPLLAEYPRFNAALAGDDLVEHLRYDVGFAVDGPEGLTVAVIRDAESRGVAELAAEVVRLADAVRDRSVAPEEVRGQTFTISNIGAVGGGYGTPIVPYGTTAILSVGRADPRPVVHEGDIVVGRRFPLSLSYDHRVIDGALGRRFLGAVSAALSK